MVSACRSSTISHLFVPVSLNSLDRKGARLPSPCGSQITITPDAGPDDSAPGDAYELKWEFDEDSQRYYVTFARDRLRILAHVYDSVASIHMIKSPG